MKNALVSAAIAVGGMAAMTYIGMTRGMTAELGAGLVFIGCYCLLLLALKPTKKATARTYDIGGKVSFEFKLTLDCDGLNDQAAIEERLTHHFNNTVRKMAKDIAKKVVTSHAPEGVETEITSRSGPPDQGDKP